MNKWKYTDFLARYCHGIMTGIKILISLYNIAKSPQQSGGFRRFSQLFGAIRKNPGKYS